MKIHRYRCTEKQSKGLIVIDPGLATAGFVFLDFKNGNMRSFYYKRPGRELLKKEFPLFLMEIKDVVKDYYSIINEMSPYPVEELSFAMEYTFLRGSFSVGILTFLTYFIGDFERKRPVGYYLYPPQAVTLVMGRRGCKGRETVKKIRGILKYDEEKKRISSHEADAFCASFCIAPKFYKKYYGLDFNFLERVEIL